MATFPNYAKIVWPDTSEQHASAVLRSEVERGIPRTRRNAADTLVSVSVTLQLFTPQRVADFESWFYAEAMAGAAWFSFTHPRTGAVVQGRMVSGFGPVRQMGNQTWSLPAVIEYIRPGFVQLPPGLHSVNPARVLSVQRNSTATYVDDAGLLQTAAANVARYQGGQLLVEDAATNRAAGSSNFSAYWATDGLSTLTPAAAAGPDGLMTATRWTRGANQYLYRQPLAEGIPAASDAVSLYVKADGWTQLRFSLMGPIPTTLKSSDFNLSAGTVTPVIGPAGTIQPLAGGWFRIALTTGDGSTPRLVELFMLSAGAGTGFLLDRFQIESGAVTSHIPTTTAPATRAADLITVAA